PPFLRSSVFGSLPFPPPASVHCHPRSRALVAAPSLRRAVTGLRAGFRRAAVGDRFLAFAFFWRRPVRDAAGLARLAVQRRVAASFLHRILFGTPAVALRLALVGCPVRHGGIAFSFSAHESSWVIGLARDVPVGYSPAQPWISRNCRS